MPTSWQVRKVEGTGQWRLQCKHKHLSIYLEKQWTCQGKWNESKQPDRRLRHTQYIRQFKCFWPRVSLCFALLFSNAVPFGHAYCLLPLTSALVELKALLYFHIPSLIRFIPPLFFTKVFFISYFTVVLMTPIFINDLYIVAHFLAYNLAIVDFHLPFLLNAEQSLSNTGLPFRFYSCPPNFQPSFTSFPGVLSLLCWSIYTLLRRSLRCFVTCLLPNLAVLSVFISYSNDRRFPPHIHI